MPLRARPLLSGVALGLVLAGFFLALVVAPAALVHTRSGALEALYGDTMAGTVSRVLARQAPPAGDAEAGRAIYMAACAVCHGADATGKGLLGLSSTPPATDLTSPRTQSKSDAQLFWIVKSGLGFTAMPAYSGQLSDNDIASVVAYLRMEHAGS